MALKKRALWSALCCLGSFDAAEMSRLLVVSRLMGSDFDAEATDLRKAMRAAGRVVDQGLETPMRASYSTSHGRPMCLTILPVELLGASLCADMRTGDRSSRGAAAESKPAPPVAAAWRAGWAVSVSGRSLLSG
jgi:hypothetical protein